MAIVPRAVRKKRGIAVLMAIFFMILLSLIAIALIGMVPVELQSSTRTKLDVQAHYAATSGIRHAKAWCSAVMTPSTIPNKPDYLGDTTDTTGNSFYNAGGSYNNEITGINGALALAEYKPVQLSTLFGSGDIPVGTSRWNSVWKMLNIPETGDTAVDPSTVVLVKKAPIVLGDWSTYVVIVPDADSPGGVNTLDSGKSKIIRAFGGSGKSGARCYQIIALTFYQGFPTLRAKSTVLEDTFGRYALFVDQDPSGSWALQANAGQTTTEGPVHTNKSFKFAINPNVWTYTDAQGKNKPPFNGIMTFGTYADAASGVDVNKNYDGNLYANGNIASGPGTGTDSNYRPFNDAGGEVGDRYSKMIAGGKSNLRKTAEVRLPPNSNKIADAAYGTNYGMGNYNTGAATSALYPDGKPDGIFVFPNSSNKVAGGVVIKGNQKGMILEVVNSTGKPVGVDTVSGTSVIATATDLAALENGTAPGNPAMRVQSEKSATTASTWTVTTSSVSTGSTRVTLTTGSTFRATTITNRTSIGRSTIAASGSYTLYSTQTNWTTTPRTTVSTSFSTGTSTTTITGRTPTTLTTGTSYTTVGGAGGNIQAIPLTTVSTITNFTTQSTVTSRSVGQSVLTTGSGSTSNTTRISTGMAPNTGSSISTIFTTQYTPTSTLSYLTTRSWSTTSVTNTQTITSSAVQTYNPIDQLIEAKNSAVTLSPSMFTNNGTNNYRRPAGASGSGSDMDVSKLNVTQMLVADGSGNLTPMGASRVVNKGEVVIIKQSRTDPQQAIVYILPADPAEDGSLLNGAVYAEGNIGTDSVGGVAGVNYGRKSIGTQIRDATGTNSANLFDKQPSAPSKVLGIANNVWQFGTARNETNKDNFKADNGLGLVSENLNINASPNDFTSFAGGNINPNYASDRLLNIHAVIMGGSSVQGGLTVKGFQDVNSITPGNLGANPNQTPLVRFVGGLILQNYYARINGITGAGWNSMNIYNQQLALSPPPWFPNNGLLIPLSYIEERIWADHN